MPARLSGGRKTRRSNSGPSAGPVAAAFGKTHALDRRDERALKALSGALQVAAHPANFFVHVGSHSYGMEPLGALEPGGCAGQLAPINGALSCWLFAFIPADGLVTELSYDDGAYVGTTALSIPPGPAIHLEAGIADVSAATGVSVSVTLSSQNSAATQVDRSIDFTAFREDGSSINGYWVGNSLGLRCHRTGL